MSKKLTIDEVRLKVNRYHQGLTVPDQPYVNNETKLRVVCNLHGEFYTAAAELRRGVGCPECGKLKSRKSRSVNNKSKILSGLVAAHPELSFSHFDEDYTTATGLIRVTCPIHGEFRKAPHKMITSRQGCPHCGKERSVQSRKYSLDKVISLFKKAHGDRYDYSEVLDAYFMDKVKIKCKLHGPFWQSAQTHAGGQGCPVCAFDVRPQCKPKTFDEFLVKVREVHGDTYNYSPDGFEGFSGKIKVLCSEHGEFNPRVADHLYGSGCPLCAPKGFDKGAPGVFYVYEISHLGQDYIGYGITGNLEQRDKAHQTTFKSHGAVGTLLKTFTFESGESCAELETSVKEHFSLFTTGMDGFKTESTHLHNLEKLLNYALSWKSRSA